MSAKSQKPKKLSINKSTLRTLTDAQMFDAKGAYVSRSYNTRGYCSTESNAGGKCYTTIGGGVCYNRP